MLCSSAAIRRHAATRAAGLQYEDVQGATANSTCGMDARRVVVQVAEATLSAANSNAAQRGCRSVIAVIIAVVVVTMIIDAPNREELWITQSGRKEIPEK